MLKGIDHEQNFDKQIRHPPVFDIRNFEKNSLNTNHYDISNDEIDE